VPQQVLTEKLGTPDKATTYKLVQQRQADPNACASPVCDWYDAKLQRLALLEFDRDRKSMGVIARQTPYTRHSGEPLVCVVELALAAVCVSAVVMGVSKVCCCPLLVQAACCTRCFQSPAFHTI
jgi:hypothetical protein